GRLVHVSEVESGRECGCVCVQCGSPMIARKGNHNVHHCGHDGSSNCSAESALHQLAKEILRDRIQAAIAAHSSIPIKWECSACDDTHEGNLLKRANTVSVEYVAGPVRADLALADAGGRFYC